MKFTIQKIKVEFSKWLLILVTVLGIGLTSCEKEETLIFNSNGTFEYIYFDEDMDGNCLLDESISSTWSNDGDGFYTQYIENDVATKEIIFENNTFYFEDYYDNETPDDTSDDMTFKDVFIKQ